MMNRYNKNMLTVNDLVNDSILLIYQFANFWPIDFRNHSSHFRKLLKSFNFRKDVINKN